MSKQDDNINDLNNSKSGKSFDELSNNNAILNGSPKRQSNGPSNDNANSSNDVNSGKTNDSGSQSNTNGSNGKYSNGNNNAKGSNTTNNSDNTTSGLNNNPASDSNFNNKTGDSNSSNGNNNSVGNKSFDQNKENNAINPSDKSENPTNINDLTNPSSINDLSSDGFGKNQSSGFNTGSSGKNSSDNSSINGSGSDSGNNNNNKSKNNSDSNSSNSNNPLDNDTSPVDNLFDKAKSMPKKIMTKGVAGTEKVANKLHINLSGKQAKNTFVGLIATLSILFGAVGLNIFSDHKVLDAPVVCDTRNDGDIAYGGGGSDNGSDEAWTQQGTTTYNNALETIKMLKDLGFSGNAIAGICGNIVQESRFDTSLENQTEASGNSAVVPADQAGYGLFQWTLGRRVQLNNLAKAQNKPISDLNLQLGLIKSDLSTSSNWVSAYKPISPSILNHSDSPEDAAKRFYLSQFIAGGGNSSSPDGSDVNRMKFAKQAYTVFNLSNIKGDDAKVDGLLGGDINNDASHNSALAEGLNAANCNNTDVSNTDDLLGAAKSMLGYFTYSQPNRLNVAKSGSYKDIQKLSDIDKNGQTDCSGFVWLAMRLAGYAITDDMWATPTMESDGTGEHKYLKEISASEAGPGTVIVVNVNGGDGNNGHTGILEEKWNGNSTMVINQGGGINNGVSEAELQNCFGSVDSNNKITTGTLVGGQVKFYVPTNKASDVEDKKDK